DLRSLSPHGANSQEGRYAYQTGCAFHLLNLLVGIYSWSRAAGARAGKVHRHAAPAGCPFHLLAFERPAEDNVGRVALQGEAERKAELVAAHPALANRNRAHGPEHRTGDAGKRSAERAIRRHAEIR